MFPRLGIGLPYIAALPADLYRPGVIDFVEMTPESICRQRSDAGQVRIDLVPMDLDTARRTCGDLPLVVHGVELSIGSAHGWNDAYLDMLDTFQRQWPFLWHSEHLSYQTVAEPGETPAEIGVPLPLPRTLEVATMVAERSVRIQQRYEVPFLLENPAHYFPDLPTDPEIGNDAGLMRAILDRSGGFALLDIHNIYCNATNHRFDAYEEIDRMPLDRVVEMHVAGGSWQGGFLTDGHNGAVEEEVWRLLDYAIPRCPNLGGVVFEMLEEPAIEFGADAIEKELEKARAIWNRHRQPACTS